MSYVIKLDNLYLTAEGIGEALPTVGFVPIKFSSKKEALDTAIILNKLNAYTNNKSIFKVYKFTEEEVSTKPTVKHGVEIEE